MTLRHTMLCGLELHLTLLAAERALLSAERPGLRLSPNPHSLTPTQVHKTKQLQTL